MKNQIGITNDLADIFIIQAMKEGYCNFFTGKTQEARDAHSKILIQRGGYSEVAFREGFDRLAHLLIMYDFVRFPLVNSAYYLQGKITESFQIEHSMPYWFYSDNQIDTSNLSDEQATAWKPIIMSAINNINFDKDYIAYAEKRAGSIKELFSYRFDRMYNHANTSVNLDIDMDFSSAYCKRAENDPLDYPCPERCAFYTDIVLISMMKELMVYFCSTKSNKCDYYSKIFQNLSTETEVTQAYIIVKERISNILTLQPAFNDITEILSFRKKKRGDIIALRNEISIIEELLHSGGTESAIKQAIKDVRSANEALIRGTASKKMAQIATYFSVPISLFEYLTFGTPFSMLFSVVGTCAQLKSDLDSKHSNWLFVAR